MFHFPSPNGRRSRVMTVAASAIVAGAIAAPVGFAATEGDFLVLGDRNGTTTDETEIISNEAAGNSNKGGYSTRQSNLSNTGGGAIYGCRSTAKVSATDEKLPCVRANNLSSGLAFEFQASNGVLGGTINVAKGGDTTKPFTTNATGVATGLNADRVDGKSADDIVNDAKAGTKAGLVGADGALANPRGLRTAAKEETGQYLVTADADIAKCVPQATLLGTKENPGGTVTVEPVVTPQGVTQLRVRTLAAPSLDTTDQAKPTLTSAPADRSFSVTVTC